MNKQLPNICPGCGNGLSVQRFECGRCDTAVEGTNPLPVLATLSAADQVLVVNLIKASGSLKQ